MLLPLFLSIFCQTPLPDSCCGREISILKKPDVRNFSARNSGVGNGRARFRDFRAFLLETPHAHRMPWFGGGGWVFLERGGRGGSAAFIFFDAGIFLINEGSQTGT